MALSLGGDGTFLRTAACVGSAGIPILGINLGRLGFLATIRPDELEHTLDEIEHHDYQVEERSTLFLESEGEAVCGDQYPFPQGIEAVALNEIAILKRDSSSMISIHTTINGQPLTTYQADGLVVSTPTGSTAYSLSNGGPIIVPQADTMCLTPVAPHSLHTRPIVVPDSWRLTLQVDSRSHNFLVALDGRNYTCSDKTTLTIRRGDYPVRVVKRPAESFFHTLRGKLGWDTDVRTGEL
jgi:NAD+ kinase